MEEAWEFAVVSNPELTKNVSQAIGTAITGFVGPSANELGEFFADKVRFLRWKSSVKIIEKAKNISEDTGGINKTPDLKFFVPWMEAASLEDENSDLLHEMWANLLVSSARSNQESANAVLFIDILKKMTREHAEIFQQFFVEVKPCGRNYSESPHNDNLDSFYSYLEDFLNPNGVVSGEIPYKEWGPHFEEYVLEFFSTSGNLLHNYNITGTLWHSSYSNQYFNDHDQQLALLEALKVLGLIYEVGHGTKPVFGKYSLSFLYYHLTNLGVDFFTSCGSHKMSET